ncbi:uncharacterized protein PGTG_04179 [Puccinia graminis f. sp. tritici CRL 75-36-700-3]|uniref:Uncharacterized protein n=1 Tax=Puccinia graminis f. sp. tritici (strain CRL 75-36-700-3 / race SCCL) TaxID=418459 RepID=E3K1P8_PUCGT|nr:uncharacterized protein PGTG_04179 [Puccinia graminis f. sp. tritici CRL 75-36-700-3]EFP78223.1 hypothetical protein PGTG_04179 [Puccinia graminis f. sp. tritici CRL 75-36-700-3]
MTDYPDVVSETYAREVEIAPNVSLDGGAIEPGMKTLEFEAPKLCHMVKPPINTSWPRSDRVTKIYGARVKFRFCQQRTYCKYHHERIYLSSEAQHPLNRVKFRPCQQKIYCKYRHEKIYLSSEAQHALMYPPPPPRKRQMLVSSARHLIGDVTEANNRLE